MQEIYRNELIDMAKFAPNHFPILSKLNHHKIKKILKECSFQLFLKDEIIDVPFGIIVLTGFNKLIK